MATETWTRGRILTASTYYRFHPAAVAAWGDWKKYALVSNTTGSSDLVTSERRNLNKRKRLIGWRRVKRGRGWNVVPVFQHYRLMRHLSQPNPCNITKRAACGTDTETPELPLGSGQKVQFKGQIIDSLTTIPTLGNDVAENLRKVVASDLYQKASTADFEFHTQVGEMLETIAMLRKPLSTLRAASSMLYQKMKKRTKRLRGKDLQEAIGGTWLEYSFGVSPLIFGTAEIVSSLVDATRPPSGHYKKISSYREMEVTQSITEQWRQIHPSYAAQVLLRTHRKEVAWVHGGMWLGATASDMTQSARFGITSMRGIVTQAYALLPLSFALDWIIGIGPLLQECVPPRGKILSSYITTGIEVTEARQLLRYRTYSTFPEIAAVSTGTATSSRLFRTTAVSPPGSLQWGPGLFSLSQGLSGAALAAGPMTKLWSKLPWH